MLDNNPRHRAVKHLVQTSSLNGLIDMDRIFDVVAEPPVFRNESQWILFRVVQVILDHYNNLQVGEVIHDLDDLDRQAALEALTSAFSLKEEWV